MRRFQQPFDHSASEFIQLDGGRLYLRKFQVEGLEWEKRYDEGEEVEPRLKVYLSDPSSPIYLYGDDAASMMAAFDLPLEHPWTRTSD